MLRLPYTIQGSQQSCQQLMQPFQKSGESPWLTSASNISCNRNRTSPQRQTSAVLASVLPQNCLPALHAHTMCCIVLPQHCLPALHAHTMCRIVLLQLPQVPQVLQRLPSLTLSAISTPPGDAVQQAGPWSQMTQTSLWANNLFALKAEMTTFSLSLCHSLRNDHHKSG